MHCAALGLLGLSSTAAAAVLAACGDDEIIERHDGDVRADGASGSVRRSASPGRTAS